MNDTAYDLKTGLSGHNQITFELDQAQLAKRRNIYAAIIRL